MPAGEGAGGHGAGMPAAPVLLATADDLLRAEVARLAAGAGCLLRPSSDLADVRRSWPLGPAVLVGADLVVDLAQQALPRRSGVHVLVGGAPEVAPLRAAVSVGAESVVELPAGAADLADVLGDLGDDERAPGGVLAVVGGSGGLGVSVLTVAVAEVERQRGRDAVAVDLDPWSAGLHLLAGTDPSSELDWDGLAAGHGRLNATALRESLAARRGLPVLGWSHASPRAMPPPAVVAEVVAAARRGHDRVVLDAPGADAWPSCDAVLLVVAGSVHGLAAASRVVPHLPAGVPVGLAVRSARRDGWAPEAARALSLPLWTVVTHQRGLDEDLSAGLGPARRSRSPVSRAARDVLDVLDDARGAR